MTFHCASWPVAFTEPLNYDREARFERGDAVGQRRKPSYFIAPPRLCASALKTRPPAGVRGPLRLYRFWDGHPI